LLLGICMQKDSSLLHLEERSKSGRVGRRHSPAALLWALNTSLAISSARSTASACSWRATSHSAWSSSMV
jgi:hypothetical protein